MEWLTSWYDRFTSKEIVPTTHWIEGCVHLRAVRASLDILPWPGSVLNKLRIGTVPLSQQCHALGPQIMWLLLVRHHAIFKTKWYQSKSNSSSKYSPLYEFQLTESVFLAPPHHFLKNQEGHLDNQLWGESTCCCICEICPSCSRMCVNLLGYPQNNRSVSKSRTFFTNHHNCLTKQMDGCTSTVFCNWKVNAHVLLPPVRTPQMYK